MIETVAAQEYHEWLTGSDSVEDTAENWVYAEFSAPTVSDWWDAGCFDAEQTAKLRDAGLTPDDVSGNCKDHGFSWGYGFSNCDVSLEDVLDAAAR